MVACVHIDTAMLIAKMIAKKRLRSVPVKR